MKKQAKINKKRHLDEKLQRFYGVERWEEASQYGKEQESTMPIEQDNAPFTERSKISRFTPVFIPPLIEETHDIIRL